MPEKYYVDTLIWRDYYENRRDRFRPLGELAFQFFKKAINEESLIFCSDFIEHELLKDYDEEKIQDIFSIIDRIHILRRLEVKAEQFKEAAGLCKERKVPFGDALHAIVARDAGAIVITRDHHFEELQDIVISKKPEDLL
jgi:predicted nucleic acid-binding protein